MEGFIEKNFLVLLLALLSGLATLLGVYLGSRSQKSIANIVFGTAFAAAMMILISLCELIPDAYRFAGLDIVLWVIIGIFIVWMINKILPHLHSVKEIEDCDRQCLVRVSYLLAIGLIFHDFPEGFAISSSFGSSSGLGLLLVIATFIHNIPEGYVLTVSSAGYKNDKFFYKSALFSGISTLSGAVLGMFLVHFFSFLNPIFLALAAGAMLFISFHELIPTSLKEGRRWSFATGVSVAAFLYFIIDVAL